MSSSCLLWGRAVRASCYCLGRFVLHLPSLPCLNPRILGISIGQQKYSKNQQCTIFATTRQTTKQDFFSPHLAPPTPTFPCCLNLKPWVDITFEALQILLTLKLFKNGVLWLWADVQPLLQHFRIPAVACSLVGVLLSSPALLAPCSQPGEEQPARTRQIDTEHSLVSSASDDLVSVRGAPIHRSHIVLALI